MRERGERERGERERRERERERGEASILCFDSTQPLSCLSILIVVEQLPSKHVSWVQVPPEQLFVQVSCVALFIVWV